MDKSIYTREYAAALQVLREARQESGVTQAAPPQKTNPTPPYLTEFDRGVQRRRGIRQASAIRKPDPPAWPQGAGLQTRRRSALRYSPVGKGTASVPSRPWSNVLPRQQSGRPAVGKGRPTGDSGGA